jgi:hypothetical protein
VKVILVEIILIYEEIVKTENNKISYIAFFFKLQSYILASRGNSKLFPLIFLKDRHGERGENAIFL